MLDLFHTNDEKLVSNQGLPQTLSARLSDTFVQPVNEQLNGICVEMNHLGWVGVKMYVYDLHVAVLVYGRHIPSR